MIKCLSDFLSSGKVLHTSTLAAWDDAVFMLRALSLEVFP